ncbi:MAG: farnesyl diphosphate synthase [Planctomycetota bacterium]
MDPWERAFEKNRRCVEAALRRFLARPPECPSLLHRAMTYSVRAGGKRLRPVLALLATEACGGRTRDVLPAACAIELIHTYSLIHDDLPAMDDDDFRRGRPSNHKMFGEGMAILAGDGLLTVAFELVARRTPRKAVVPALVAEIAAAAGWAGMVGGQAVDLLSEGKRPEHGTLKYIHRHKTAALLRASVMVGGIAAGASPKVLRALASYGEHVGIAFQMADDILDICGSTKELGKTAGKDAAARKMTWPALVGLDRTRTQAARHARIAREAVSGFGEKGRALAGIADFIVSRRS